jgi:hypothetical protein
MSTQKKKTIRSMANSLAAQRGFVLDDNAYRRYYSKTLRQGYGGCHKFYMAAYIVDMFILSEASTAERICPGRPAVYSGCSVRYINL